MSDVESRLAENLGRLRGRIDEAAGASGRRAGAVTLVAATKYLSAAMARQLVQAGCHDLGESRPQELWSKAAALADLPIRWHFIGHLQRNKIRRTLPPVTLIHSIDSRRLLTAINDEATALGRPVRALVEVNISGEAAKHGFTDAELEQLFDEWPGYSHVQIRGFMGMAGLAGDPADAERDFSRLRALRDRLAAGRLPPGVSLDELSMGMSGDFEAAIRQGATLVRIGSALSAGLEGRF
jgi:PLP dependent protein